MVITKLLEFVRFLTFLMIAWWYTENINADIKSNREKIYNCSQKKKKPICSNKLECCWEFLFLYILADNTGKKYPLAPNSIDVD